MGGGGGGERDAKREARGREKHFMSQAILTWHETIPIDGFHSRDLQSCGTQMTKAMTAMLMHIAKEAY